MDRYEWGQAGQLVSYEMGQAGQIDSYGKGTGRTVVQLKKEDRQDS